MSVYCVAGCGIRTTSLQTQTCQAVSFSSDSVLRATLLRKEERGKGRKGEREERGKGGKGERGKGEREKGKKRNIKEKKKEKKRKKERQTWKKKE